MKTISSLVLSARLENLPAFIAFGMQAAESGCVTREKLYKIELALEESLVNIIDHAYGGMEGDIRLTCGTDSRQWFVIEITDKGKPFDATAMPPPDLGCDLETRRVGGLGIHFIRTLMDEVSYQRKGVENVLELRIASGIDATGAAEH